MALEAAEGFTCSAALGLRVLAAGGTKHCLDAGSRSGSTAEALAAGK